MNENDHVILARMDERLANVEKQLENHLHFHQKLDVSLIIVAISTIISFILVLVR